MENFDLPGLPEEEKNKFKETFRHQNLPSDLEDKTVQELRRRGLFNRSFFNQHKYLRYALSISLLAIVFISGFFLGTSKMELTATSSTGQYLLLLYNPSGFLEGESHAKEYGDWFRSIKKNSVEGDELKNKGWTMSLQDGNPAAETNDHNNAVSGYFIIHADSEKEALAVAGTCPHLKYRGKIEVRPIQTHN
jgi:hypothetical protein